MKEKVRLVEVTTKKSFSDFVDFQFKLYENCSYWVPPIKKEEIDTINPKTNPVYQNASARFYLAYREGEIVGRIAAIINWLEINQVGKNKVRFGWFDAINDINVSKVLLNAVELFGKENNLTTIEGPVGFSNLDKAGLLIEGFQELNTMITLYNYPYYKHHLERIGYTQLAVWIEYEIQIASFEKAPEKIKRFSDLIKDRYKLKVLTFKKRKDILPYVDQMFDLLDKTYNKLQTYVPVQSYQIKHYKDIYLRYIHPDFIKCVTDQKNEMVGFVITMPSFAKALKKANGKMYPFGFLYILWASFFVKKVSFYLIGIRPDYQNKGVTSILFNELQKLFNKRNIKMVETNPELDENAAIQNTWKNYEHRIHKRRATYSKKIN